MMISSASGRRTMPLITRRVVCGLLLVIATLVPTSAFMSVDLPTLGRPAKHAKPAEKPSWPAGRSGCACTTLVILSYHRTWADQPNRAHGRASQRPVRGAASRGRCHRKPHE